MNAPAHVIDHTARPWTFDLELVTPATAERWLDRNKGNRRLAKNTVVEYAAAMRRGEWMFNGETIKFDLEGNLLDGQHRLAAVTVYGKPVEFGVFRGLPRDAFKTIDTGKKRNAADIVGLRGVPNQSNIATAARLLFQYGLTSWTTAKLGRGRRMTNVELEALLDRHPGLLATAPAAIKSPLYAHHMPRSQSIFFLYCARSVDHDIADAFATALAFGNEMNVGPASGTSRAALSVLARQELIDALRERLIQIHGEAITTPPNVKLAWMIDTWNCVLSGGTPSRYSRTVETMPRFVPRPKFGGDTE